MNEQNRNEQRSFAPRYEEQRPPYPSYDEPRSPAHPPAQPSVFTTALPGWWWLRIVVIIALFTLVEHLFR